MLDLESLESGTVHERDCVVHGRLVGSHVLGSVFFRGTLVHLGKNLETFVASDFTDAGGKLQIGVGFSGLTDKICGALLAEVTRARSLSADRDKRRKVAQTLFLMNHNTT